jgi:hypothetical protein
MNPPDKVIAFMKKIPFHFRRRWGWILGGIFFLILIILAVLPYFINNDVLRRHAERQMNSRLKGYTVSIKSAYFHPITLALELDDLTVVQEAKPDPPVANISGLRASVYWRDLLTGHVVGEFQIDRPKIYLNLKNIRKEQESKIPLKDKGWQDALQSIFPLKINVFTVNNGELTYVDQSSHKPLKFSRINIYSTNIRNIHYPDDVYPSSFRMEGRVFEKGKLTMNGHANFLAKPHVGFKADLDLEDIDLSYFKPITNRKNISVQKGTFAAEGDIEYTSGDTKIVHFKEVRIADMNMDYIHLPQTAEEEKERIHKTVQTAKELSNKPSSKIRVDLMKIEGTLGYENRTKNPNYRLFFDQFEGTLKNFSNQFSEGEAKLEMKGKFMGTGDTVVTGTFRPETKSPDFDINVAIEDAQMPPMSDLFRAYGNFDIKAGLFSFYSELRVKNNTITGYVKPLFKDMKVYDRRQYKERNIFHKLYLGLVGGISNLLENRAHDEVATKTNISGPLENPETSTAQIILNLISNAFIKSILPGFEKEVSG